MFFSELQVPNLFFMFPSKVSFENSLFRDKSLSEIYFHPDQLAQFKQTLLSPRVKQLLSLFLFDVLSSHVFMFTTYSMQSIYICLLANWFGQIVEVEIVAYSSFLSIVWTFQTKWTTELFKGCCGFGTLSMICNAKITLFYNLTISSYICNCHRHIHTMPMNLTQRSV